MAQRVCDACALLLDAPITQAPIAQVQPNGNSGNHTEPTLKLSAAPEVR